MALWAFSNVFQLKRFSIFRIKHWWKKQILTYFNSTSEFLWCNFILTLSVVTFKTKYNFSLYMVFMLYSLLLNEWIKPYLCQQTLRHLTLSCRFWRASSTTLRCLAILWLEIWTWIRTRTLISPLGHSLTQFLYIGADSSLFMSKLLPEDLWDAIATSLLCAGPKRLLASRKTSRWRQRKLTWWRKRVAIVFGEILTKGELWKHHL